MIVNSEAAIEGGATFWKGSSGRWAGEQLLKAINENRELTAHELRANGVLSYNEWIEFDTALVEAARFRLRAVADLITRGLTRPLTNSMGKTMIQYERLSDMDDAQVSMDGMVRTENDRAEYTQDQLPVPITHKDFFINLRTLSASRNRGESLDMTNIRIAGRKIGEKQEQMLLLGSKTYGGKVVYGYTNHPFRKTGSFGTNGNWAQAAKTGDNILTDVQTAIASLQVDKMFGPYMIYPSLDAAMKIDSDFKVNGDKTIRQRLLELENVAGVQVLDFLPAATTLVVQMDVETVELVQGEPLQTVQWDIEGGFGINFKAFQIQVPLVRAMAGRSGIFHMS